MCIRDRTYLKSHWSEIRRFYRRIDADFRGALDEALQAFLESLRIPPALTPQR